MAVALRRTLALATLTLAASFLPAGGAGAADPTPRTPSLYCLANTWSTPSTSAKPCNSNDQGQHWTLARQKISLANAPAYCLANTWNAQDVSVKPCDSKDQGQYWTVTGQRISLTYAPAYCLANTWNTPNISTKPCDNNDRGQNWVVFGDQISLALA